jgi:UPF0755 protein
MVRIKRKKRFIVFLTILIIVVVSGSSLILSAFIKKIDEAVDPGNTATVPISIPMGTSTQKIGEILESNGLIADASLFRFKSKWEGYDGQYKAGEYNLSPGMTMGEIMNIILSGSDSTIRFTIPEGYDIDRTIDALASIDLIEGETFKQAIIEGDFDYPFLTDIPKDEKRLEGFLFPETYEIYTDATEYDIIDKMLNQFNKIFTEEYYERAEELGLTIREAITLASIIEREARVPEDRPIIAGVFHNRLKINMPLQSCATVQYILGEQKAVLTTKDLGIESPYNTYFQCIQPCFDHIRQVLDHT